VRGLAYAVLFIGSAAGVAWLFHTGARTESLGAGLLSGLFLVHVGGRNGGPRA
jgi:hypothetical protein